MPATALCDPEGQPAVPGHTACKLGFLLCVSAVMLLQVILMDHVDWLDEHAASQLATRLAAQVRTGTWCKCMAAPVAF